MDRIKESAYIESIYTKLKDALDLRKFKVEKVYNGRCFRIVGRGNFTDIYIRLEYRYGMTCVNFSNINIDDRLQRTGILTNLVKSVSESKYVDAIIIGGVCTKNMFAWCSKMGYKESNVPNDYIKIIKHKGDDEL